MSGFNDGTDKSMDSIRIYPLEANHTLHDASRNNRSVVKFANDVNAANSVKTKRNSVAAAFPPILKSDDANQNAVDSEKAEDEEEGEFSILPKD